MKKHTINQLIIFAFLMIGLSSAHAGGPAAVSNSLLCTSPTPGKPSVAVLGQACASNFFGDSSCLDLVKIAPGQAPACELAESDVNRDIAQQCAQNLGVSLESILGKLSGRLSPTTTLVVPAGILVKWNFYCELPAG